MQGKAEIDQILRQKSEAGEIPGVVAIAASFGFGILLNFGVGNYAPTLVILSLMGMDPRLCFPIMAAGASLCGAGASVRQRSGR